MTPKDLLQRQERQIASLTRHSKSQAAEIGALKQGFGEVQKKNEELAKKNHELILGSSFRDLMERVAEQVIPFHYIVTLTIEAASTQRVPQPFQTTAKGWFFADRVSASFRPTAGANSGEYQALCSSNPVIAVAKAAEVAVPGTYTFTNLLEFDWDYSENRTNMNRQNDSQRIPGDLLFRQDNDGYLLGGDPWAPKTTITVAVTPRVAPANDGLMFFTFMGSLCVNAKETAVQAWLQRKSLLCL
jgi:hypothetical protein